MLPHWLPFELSSISPAWQGNVRSSSKFGTQFILTTHSPQLLDAFPGEAIRWVKFSPHGTQIAPLAPDDLLALHDGLMTPGEFLTVADPSEPEPIQL